MRQIYFEITKVLLMLVSLQIVSFLFLSFLYFVLGFDIQVVSEISTIFFIITSCLSIFVVLRSLTNIYKFEGLQPGSKTWFYVFYGLLFLVYFLLLISFLSTLISGYKDLEVDYFVSLPEMIHSESENIG